MKKKFVIVYNGIIRPFIASSQEEIHKRIQKDWDKASDSDLDSFESCGLKIRFTDFAQGKVTVLPLEDWFDSQVGYENPAIILQKERFREVKEYKGYKVGDVIHIKRWYHAEGSKDFNTMGNCVMIDVKVPISKITIDDNTGQDMLWCGKFGTSSNDIANKGIVNP